MGGVWGPPPDVAWSTETSAGDWIRDRLAPFHEGVVASAIPLGFAAYARVLHPLRPHRNDVVRWAGVAAWSGRQLKADSEFHSIAFPVDDREGPPPWNAARPRRGALDPADAAVLIEILRGHTSTPDRCWFCLWDGYGWGGSAIAVASTNAPGGPAPPAPVDPIPQHVRNGPRVEMPERKYFLFAGSIHQALAFSEYRSQTPNLFWPDDKAWCVATEIDRSCTYVAGSTALIEQIVASGDMEAFAIDPSTQANRFESWVEELAHSATETLLAQGETTITTTQGTIRVWIEDSGGFGRKKTLVRSWAARDGRWRGEGRTPLGKSNSDDRSRDVVGLYLAMDIVGLVD
jgi:hypothetical protein